MEDFFEELENRPRPNIFRRIALWWRFDGRYYHKYFKQGIKNLWYWFPIIWKDRDWDDHYIFYIFEVLKHKLKAQAKYIGDRDFHIRAQLAAKRMRLCVKLIQLVQDETYAMEYMDYHKDRVWFTPCEDIPGAFRYNSEEVWEKYDEYFKKYPLVYKKVLKGAGPFTLDGRDESEIKRIIAMNISHINQDRVQKLLFKILEENIRGSWD
jgi:hypothetical protein